MVKDEMIENCVGPGCIAKKGEELVSEELTMIPVDYLEPYCHCAKMVPCFSYRTAKRGIYKQFVCLTCKHYQSRCIAKPI